jgi:hypothetical protein
MVNEANKDISKFNEYVNDQLNILAIRGETNTDIIITLLTVYFADSD